MRPGPPPHRASLAGFTLVEAVTGIAVLGIGVACTVGGLTKINAIACAARNATGAYTAVMNQIDLIQSDSPFNPQKTNLDGTAQIPPPSCKSAPTLRTTCRSIKIRIPGSSWPER